MANTCAFICLCQTPNSSRLMIQNVVPFVEKLSVKARKFFFISGYKDVFESCSFLHICANLVSVCLSHKSSGQMQSKVMLWLQQQSKKNAYQHFYHINK